MTEGSLTEKQVKAALADRQPQSRTLPVLVTIGGRMYKHESGSYRLLDNKAHASVKELANDGP